MSKFAQDELDKPFRQANQDQRPCDSPGCREAGIHRAPVSRQRLDSYYWFCLEHVRAYNASWDYFDGMNEGEIEDQRRTDAVWGKPTWPFGSPRQRWDYGSEGTFRDDFGFFSWQGRTAQHRGPYSERDRALEILGLDGQACFETVKTRYKELVKKLHPDANGHDAGAEERLKRVNQAYATLRQVFSQ